jgi:acyl-CoA thioester hydrolase
MECDAQGIVFNGAYLGYPDGIGAEYFRHLGFSIYKIAQRGYFDSAVVKASLEFKAPARVDDLLDLYVLVSRIGNTSLILEVAIYPQESDRLLTTMEAVYVGFHPQSGATRPVPRWGIGELVTHFEAPDRIGAAPGPLPRAGRGSVVKAG